MEFKSMDMGAKEYDEALGIFASKKFLLKNEHKKLFKNTTLCILNFIKILLIGCICLILLKGIEIDIMYNVLYALITTGLFLCLYMYFNTKNMSLKISKDAGVIKVTKTGIIEKNKDVSIDIKYSVIDLIVITDNLVVFLLNKPLIVYIKLDEKDDLVNEVRKYCDVKIIDRRNR